MEYSHDGPNELYSQVAIDKKGGNNFRYIQGDGPKHATEDITIPSVARIETPSSHE